MADLGRPRRRDKLRGLFLSRSASASAPADSKSKGARLNDSTGKSKEADTGKAVLNDERADAVEAGNKNEVTAADNAGEKGTKTATIDDTAACHDEHESAKGVQHFASTGIQDDSRDSHHESKPVSVYKEALQQLADNDRALLDNSDDLDDCIKNAELLRNTCYRATIHWQFHGKTVFLRDQTDKLLTVLDAFKPVGDYIADLDSTHFALPWSGVKLVLDIALKNREQRETLLQGIERCLHCKSRLKVYETTLESSSQAAQNLRESLVKLNVKILNFLLVAVRACKANAVVKLAQPWWIIPQIETFDQECEQILATIHRDASAYGFESTHIKIAQIKAKLDDISDKLDLQDLDSAAVPEAAIQGEGCLDRTRLALLSKIDNWAKSDERTFLLRGKAGTGKSTIATTVAEVLPAHGLIVASFSFSKTAARQQDAKYVWPTVLQQLLKQIPHLRPHVARALPLTAPLSTKQYQNLVEAPLKACGMPLSNICLVVDAMDECQTNIKQLIKIMETTELRLFITSRPEIVLALNAVSLDSIDPEEDIKLFIRDEIDADDDKVTALAAKTTPSFVIASTICKYINEGDSEDKIERLLQTQAIADLVIFYTGILNDICRKLSVQGRIEFVNDFHSIVGALTILADPLDVESLAELLEFKASRVDSTIRKLQSILNIEGTITPHHITFYECIVQGHGEFGLDKHKARLQMTHSCLNLLRSTLKPNFFDMDRQDADHTELTTVRSRSLRYACRHWSYHIQENQARHDFLASHLLHWLELMSWQCLLSSALQILSDVAATASPPYEALLKDSEKFLRQNYNIISLAPLQLYSSALLFSSQSSTIKEQFGHVLMQQTIFKQLPMGPQTWESSRWSLPYGVVDVAISSDCTKAAMVCADDALRILSLKDGALVANVAFLEPDPLFLLIQEETVVIFEVESPVNTAMSTFHMKYNVWTRQTLKWLGELLAVSPDMQYGVLIHNGKTYLEDLSGHRTLLCDTAVTRRTAALTASVTAVACYLDGLSLQVFSNKTRRLIHTICPANIDICHLAITADYVALVAEDLASVRIWNLDTLECLNSVNAALQDVVKDDDGNTTMSSKVHRIRFSSSPDSIYIDVTLSMATLSIDLTNQTSYKFATTHRNDAYVECMTTWHVNEGRFLCSVKSPGENKGNLYYYDNTQHMNVTNTARDGIEKYFVGDMITAWKYSTVLAIGSYRSLSVWTSSLDLIVEIPTDSHSQHIDISPDNLWVLNQTYADKTGASVLYLVDTVSKTTEILLVSSHIDLSFTIDSQYLVYGDDNDSIVVWSLQARRPVMHCKALPSLPFGIAEDLSGVLVTTEDVPGYKDLALYSTSGEILFCKSDVDWKMDIRAREQAAVAIFDERIIQFTALNNDIGRGFQDTVRVVKPKLFKLSDNWLYYHWQPLIWIPSIHHRDNEEEAVISVDRKALVLGRTEGLMCFELADES